MKNLCMARTRRGTPCLCRPLPGKRRCKYHGGASTGPKTTAGRARSAANLENWKMEQAEKRAAQLDEICERLALGETLNSICKTEGMANRTTVHRWSKDPAIDERLLSARQHGVWALLDRATERLEAADATNLMQAREIANHLRWTCEKLAPRIFGNKAAVDHKHEVTVVERVVGWRDAGGPCQQCGHVPGQPIEVIDVAADEPLQIEGAQGEG